MIALNFRDQLDPTMADELDQLVIGIRDYLFVEHNEDGRHGDITANSITVRATGDIRNDLTLGGQLILDGGTTVGDDIDVVGDATIAGDAEIGGRLRLKKPFGVHADAYVAVTIDGDTTIEDQNGSAPIWEPYPAMHVTSAINTPRIVSIEEPAGGLPNDTRMIWLVNRTSTSIVIVHNSGAGTGLGILCPAAENYTLHANQGVWLYYDPQDDNWFLIASRQGTAGTGVWTAVAHAGGNFTANGSMTWTVESGDQITFAYLLEGKTMTVSFVIENSSVGGTGNTELRIAIPASQTANRTMESIGGCTERSGSASSRTVRIRVESGSTIIRLMRSDDSVWDDTSTNDTDVRGQITFEVQ